MSEQAARQHARQIWQAAVDAVQPAALIRATFVDPSLPLRAQLEQAKRIIVVGAGKADAAMAEAVEEVLADSLHRLEGLVNVPAPPTAGEAQANHKLQRIRLHIARPAASNQPTAEGVVGTREIQRLVAQAGPDDVALCLLSGGGSALMPAPIHGITLVDKQQVTLLLHRCGATINEMNAVRKHLSAIKGGRLAQTFTGCALFSLIISDVIGDPLDVIASGPTAPDPTTFADSLAVLHRYGLLDDIPASVRHYLERGERGEEAETPKKLPANIHNLILGNNQKALHAAQLEAERLGYRVLNLGSFVEGETREIAAMFAGIIRSIRNDHVPQAPPVCILSGGETTVTMPADHGLGGRNQELILALANKLGPGEMIGVTLLSGGTDGEDGPTDAAGALADAGTLQHAGQLGLDPAVFLARHDAYHFFAQTGDLLQTGLTQTNVMDVRVLLVLNNRA
jgi:hydroxypyruvate reductase/glycerate 2-kinase